MFLRRIYASNDKISQFWGDRLPKAYSVISVYLNAQHAALKGIGKSKARNVAVNGRKMPWLTHGSLIRAAMNKKVVMRVNYLNLAYSAVEAYILLTKIKFFVPLLYIFDSCRFSQFPKIYKHYT